LYKGHSKSISNVPITTPIAFLSFSYSSGVAETFASSSALPSSMINDSLAELIDYANFSEETIKALTIK